MAMDYKSAGVDVEAGYKAVEMMKEHVKGTARPGVLTGIGSFGGLFSLAQFKNMDEPVLVSGTDGVGTKLKIAFAMDKHDTIGIDAVAMCVNDIICCGAEPLFFLDYIATGKNVPEKMADIVKGVAEGCKQAGCALVGGETAEMPGMYHDGEYDLAGFAVGIVDRAKMIDGSGLQEDDALIGLASSGLHSNGFSLVRKVFEPLEAHLSEYGETLLTPTEIYVKTVLALKEQVNIKGIAHITGGGFIENIPRMFPEGSGLGAIVYEKHWDVSPIFEELQKRGNLDRVMMYNTFNMGIGMVLAVGSEEAQKTLRILKKMGEKAAYIGYLFNKNKPEEEAVRLWLK